jgi:hypothetical protein
MREGKSKPDVIGGHYHLHTDNKGFETALLK